MDEHEEDESKSIEEFNPENSNPLNDLAKEAEWLIDSDAESDDILKSHFENEKKIKENKK